LLLSIKSNSMFCGDVMKELGLAFGLCICEGRSVATRGCYHDDARRQVPCRWNGSRRPTKHTLSIADPQTRSQCLLNYANWNMVRVTIGTSGCGLWGTPYGFSYARTRLVATFAFSAYQLGHAFVGTFVPLSELLSTQHGFLSPLKGFAGFFADSSPKM
jgi:hypothetical protein